MGRKELEDLSGEEWRPIPGYEGHYSVSNLGRVRSEDRTFLRHGSEVRVRRRMLKQIVIQDNRRRVSLSLEGKVSMRKVHQLVVEAFVGPRPAGLVVCHNNGDPSDNRLENLRYDTLSENMHDVVRHGRHHGVNKTHCKWGHEFTPENIYWSPSKKNVRECLTCKQGRDFHRVSVRSPKNSKGAPSVAGSTPRLDPHLSEPTQP